VGQDLATFDILPARTAVLTDQTGTVTAVDRPAPVVGIVREVVGRSTDADQINHRARGQREQPAHLGRSGRLDRDGVNLVERTTVQASGGRRCSL
jgi:hypothetical protein